MEVTKAQQIMARLLRRNGVRVMENIQLTGGEADLCLEEYKVVIELDGFFHLSEQSKRLDEKKSGGWEREGYRVFRFTNEEIYRSPENCLHQVTSYIRALKKATRNSPNGKPLRDHKGLEAMGRRLKEEEQRDKPVKAGQKRHPEAYFLSLSGPEEAKKKRDK